MWDRAWCLDAWFDCLEANVDPAATGLVFVVPPSDQASREVITRRASVFDWVEVLRDRKEQSGRDARAATGHDTLATARNQMLQLVWQIQPDFFLSWDSDLLVPPDSIAKLQALDVPIVTTWTWLNRQQPKRIRHFDDEIYHEVLWQDPVAATAMRWDPRAPGRALHYPAHEFAMRSVGTWRCDVALAFTLMQSSVYRVAHYAPHPDGEELPFNAALERRGIQRFCSGDTRGLHLYDRTATDEIQMGWPQVMELASQDPLAATWVGRRSPEFEAFGFFPVQGAAA